MSDAPDQTVSDELQELYRKAFPERLRWNNQRFIDELRASFAIGSDLANLTDEQRSVHASQMNEIADLYSKVPDIKPVEELLLANLSEERNSRLDIANSDLSNGSSGGLSRIEREGFAHFGLAPPRTVESLSSDHIDRIVACCDELFERNLNSSLCYLFDTSLLDLVMNSEIHERVCSVLGDDVTFVGCSGPMYRQPQTEKSTQWHTASGRAFGGGTRETNLDLVTCWVALTDATVDNGCMLILPRSFPYHLARNALMAEHSGSAAGTPAGDSSTVMNYAKYLASTHGLRFDLDILSTVMARRLCRAPRYISKGVASGGLYWDISGTLRYNVFHSGVDYAMLFAGPVLDKVFDREVVAIEAKRGSMFPFSSMNMHGSLMNTSSDWRKAISLRFVKTGGPHVNKADGTPELIRNYARHFPGVEEVLRRMNKSISSFDDAAPRIRIRGSIPKGQEDLYVDPDLVRRALGERGSLVVS